MYEKGEDENKSSCCIKKIEIMKKVVFNSLILILFIMVNNSNIVMNEKLNNYTCIYMIIDVKFINSLTLNIISMDII